MRQTKSRIREISDGLLNHPRWYAVGHMSTAAFVAASIAFATAQTSQVGWLAANKPVWYGTASILPILLSSLSSLLWHHFGAPWLTETSYRGWVLHSFSTLPRDRIHLNMPAPETYLIIAAAASAGAIITLEQQSWLVKTLTASIVGGLTASSIVFASPSAGAVAVKGKLALQAERTYLELLRSKRNTQGNVLIKQNWLCYDCGLQLPRKGMRFCLIDENMLSSRAQILNQRQIKAVCRQCAQQQPTTTEV